MIFLLGLASMTMTTVIFLLKLFNLCLPDAPPNAIQASNPLSQGSNWQKVIEESEKLNGKRLLLL
jgi:hypothetical protein